MKSLSVIGVVGEYPYEVDTRVMGPRDTVMVATDDSTRRLMRREICTLYTTERMVELVRNGPASAADHPQSDEITIMTSGRNA